MKKVLILLLILTATIPEISADELDPFLGPVKIRSLLMRTCAETGVPIYVAAGLLWSESGGDFNAGHHKTCRGGWQLSIKYHTWFRDKFYEGVEFSEFDPVASTIIAVRYIAWLYRIKGTYYLALIGYKCGPNRSWDQVPEWVKTRVKQVLNDGLPDQ